MKTSIILSTLASSALALVPALRSRDTSIWYITNYSEGCSPAACVYTFDISSSNGGFEPDFTTSCVGNDIETQYATCSDTSITTLEVPAFISVILTVNHTWSDGATQYVSSGNVTIVNPGYSNPLAFTIQPTTAVPL